MGAFVVGGSTHDVREMRSYKPREGATLVLYGLGGGDKMEVANRHKGHVLSWDAGYWDRSLDLRNRKYRVSLNGLHPATYVMRGPSPTGERFSDSGLKVEQRGDPAGPILLVGNGPKSNAIGAAGWSAKKSKELRQLFPGRKIVYRPKPKRPAEPGVSCDAVSLAPIEKALLNVSLVVCRHSNVAVDACRWGIPVVCEDGAARAIYPNTYDGEQPDEATRLDFLHRLAWWQWSARELEKGLHWKWLLSIL